MIKDFSKYVCFVKHDNSDKEYLFDCSDVYMDIACGYRVVCMTSRGIESGTVISYPTEIKSSYRGGVEAIIRATGASLPLKKIIRIEGKNIQLTDAEKKKIAMDWLKSQEEDGLPFN